MLGQQQEVAQQHLNPKKCKKPTLPEQHKRYLTQFYPERYHKTYMYPEAFPQKRVMDKGALAEKVVFDVLQQIETEPMVVMHSTKFCALQAGEIDFLICHKEKGLIALEVKMGTKKSTYNEAKKQLGIRQVALKRMLKTKKDGLRNVTVRYAVVMPNLSREQADCIGVEAIFKDVLESKESFLEWLNSFMPSEGCQLTDDHYDKCLSIFLDIINEYPSINQIKERLMKLTPRQAELLEGVPEEFYISGPAGSGKTEMIILKASDPVLADQNKLVLVSKKGIKLHLEVNRLKGVPNIRVQTFAGFLRGIASNKTREKTIKRMSKCQLAHRAAQILSADSVIVPKYESIFVDEAQDLENHAAWVVILDAVHNKGQNHYKWIFFDNNQMVDYTSYLKPVNVYHLAQVIRNTVNVFDASKKFHFSDKPSIVKHGILGPDVTWLYCTDVPAVMNTLSKIVVKLWKEMGQVCPGDILIAVENKTKAKELRYKFDKHQDGVVVPFDVEQMVHGINNEYWPHVPEGKCGVTIDSISSYKSLSSKVVIVLIDSLNVETILQLYTGMTRSFCKLYMIISKKQVLQNNIQPEFFFFFTLILTV